MCDEAVGWIEGLRGEDGEGAAQAEEVADAGGDGGEGDVSEDLGVGLVAEEAEREVWVRVGEGGEWWGGIPWVGGQTSGRAAGAGGGLFAAVGFDDGRKGVVVDEEAEFEGEGEEGWWESR